MDNISSIHACHANEPSLRDSSGKLRVAIFGTGSIGTRHLGVLHQIPGLWPIAVPVRRERISQLQEAGYTAAKDLFDAVRDGATLCIVATDTGRHVKDGCAAVQAGLDVLVEKPMAINASEACRLREQAIQLGRKVYVACVLRFSESLNTFRQLVKEVGQLHSVRIECQSYLPDWRPGRPYLESYSARADEGGVLLDLIHEIDYAGWIFGWPTALQARVRNLGRLGIEAEEAADLMWETTPEGCVVSMSLDYLSRPSRRHMRALGELGSLEWDGIQGTVTLALTGAPIQIIRSSQTRDEMFLAQANAFLNTSRGIVDPRFTTAEDGVKALAVCDVARRASRNRREERVEYL